MLPVSRQRGVYAGCTSHLLRAARASVQHGAEVAAKGGAGSPPSRLPLPCHDFACLRNILFPVRDVDQYLVFVELIVKLLSR